MNRQRIIRTLRLILAQLYSDSASATLIAKDAGVDVSRLNLDNSVQVIWDAIITEAINADLIDTLIQLALDEYPRNDDLRNAYTAYQQSITHDNQQEETLHILFSKAFRAEIDGDLGYAKELYTKIRRLEPEYPRLSMRIAALKTEMKESYVDRHGQVVFNLLRIEGPGGAGKTQSAFIFERNDTAISVGYWIDQMKNIQTSQRIVQSPISGKRDALIYQPLRYNVLWFRHTIRYISRKTRQENEIIRDNLLPYIKTKSNIGLWIVL